MEARETSGSGSGEDPYTFDDEGLDRKGKGRAETKKQWTGVTRSGQRASRGRKSRPYGRGILIPVKTEDEKSVDSYVSVPNTSPPVPSPTASPSPDPIPVPAPRLATTSEEVLEYINTLQSMGPQLVDAFLSDHWDEHMSRWVSGREESVDKAEDPDKENDAGPSKRFVPGL